MLILIIKASVNVTGTFIGTLCSRIYRAIGNPGSVEERSIQTSFGFVLFGDIWTINLLKEINHIYSSFILWFSVSTSDKNAAV